jgi:hypothetical protein
MNARIELRNAILFNLLILLWLCIECMVGLQDKYIKYYPYSTLLNIAIAVFCYRRVVIEKTEQLNGKISFKQAFKSGLITTFFAAVFNIPSQLFFHTVINPDFFESMTSYSVQAGNQPKEIAAMFFNLPGTLIETTISVFISGIVFSLVFARLMYTVNNEK